MHRLSAKTGDAKVPGCAIGRFESAADYAENLRELGAVITPEQPGPFEANLIRVELPLTRLMDAREHAPRVGFLSIPRGWRYAFFAARPNLPVLWNGEVFSLGEILLAGDGERLQQRTTGAAHFGVIGIRGQTLQHYAEGLVDGAPAIPVEASVVQVQSGLLRRLLQLHARIVRTVESRPGMVCHPEAARAIEQELIEVLVTCLVNGEVRSLSTSSFST
jgi:hypothetical protein